MPGGPARVAVIDIGTNSTRLLVADVAAGAVSELDRRTRVTRLGRGVDLSGSLAAEAIEAVCEVVGEYVAAYRELGVEKVEALATSAVRDASNGDAFVAELRERFAMDARVLDAEQEALLAYAGATSGLQDTRTVLVIDIGGGSTELIVGGEDGIAFHRSLQAGVVRQSERHLASDPPATSELESLAADVLGLLREEIAEPAAVDSAIAVAGTPTSLAAIDLELDPYDPARVHGHRLSLDAIQRLLSHLASLPLAERRRVTGLDPERAPTIVAGAVILVEVMRAFGLREVTASEHDLLYGAALQAS